MIKKIAILLAVLVMEGCHSLQPDVSGIPVDIRIGRFDTYLFTRTDTSNMMHGIAVLQQAFPGFTNDFMTNILGLPPANPTNHNPAPVTATAMKNFIRIMRPLYDSLAPKFAGLDAAPTEALTHAFQHVKYYFPAYQIPQVIAYVGPMDAPGIVVTARTLAIGLHLYAGKDFSFYTSAPGIESFPAYISRRFEPQYIPVNCMKAVVDDLYPDRSTGRPLVEQMIEKGKQWYLTALFIPDCPDSLNTGYTNAQLAWCKENEGLIWNFFLESNNVFTTEPAVTKDFIGEAPHTDGMPDAAPGNIGQWVGWRIVQRYASRNSGVTPEQLMAMDAKKIFAAAQYRPR